MMVVDYGDVDEYLIYKILVLIGNVIGFLVGVVFVDCYLDEKVFVWVLGNKKVDMVFLKDFLKMIGYVYGVNILVGIYEKYYYLIFIDNEVKEMLMIFVFFG